MQDLVFDSFLVRDHRVTAADLHLDRLERAARERFGEAVAADVRRVAPDLVTQVGRGRRFPRLEAHADGVRWLDREAPAERALLRVPRKAVADSRTHAHLKGVDLDWLQQAAAPALRKGFDDVVLSGPDGVRETTTAAILLRDGDGWATPADPGLTSTTVAWLESTGLAVQHRPVLLEELWSGVDRGEAFALNALHGPRLLVGPDPLAPAAFQAGLAQVADWRDAWLDAAEPW